MASDNSSELVDINTPVRVSKSPFKTTSSTIAWSSPWYRVRQDQIVLPDGSPGVYNVVEHSGAVWIIPVTPEGEIVMIKHYRYTVDDWCWEVPAGGVNTGQTLEETAFTELKEEIGGLAESLEYIGQFYTSNGISNEVAHIYLATGVEPGVPAHEPAEVLEVHIFTIEEVLRMAHSNEISDGPTALAILLCEERLRALAF